MKEDIKEEMIFKLYDKFKDDIFKMSEEERKVVKELDIKVNEFIKSFGDNELSMLNEINVLASKKNDIVHRKIFKYAFSLGFNLAIESLNNDKNKILD